MATERDLVDAALEVADGWRLRGRWADGVALLRGVQPAAHELGATAGARVLVALARMLNDQSLFAGVRQPMQRAAVLDQALTLAQQADDPALLGEVWAVRGMALHTDYLAERAAEPAGELDCFQRGLQLRRQAGDERGVAESLFQVGLVHQVIRDDSAAALPWFEEAYARARTAADPVLMSYAIRHVAFCRLHAGDRAGARDGLQESLRLREQAGFIPGVAMALAALAEVVASDGQRQDAVALLGRAREIFASLGAAEHTAWVDQQLAEVQAGQG
jgi:tetratricopeptide (TPR) repeat protein